VESPSPLHHARSNGGRGNTIGRFLKNIVRPSICTGDLQIKRPSDALASEVAQLNCEPAAVEKYKDLIAGWLRMQTLKIKPQKAVKKPTPQKHVRHSISHSINS